MQKGAVLLCCRLTLKGAVLVLPCRSLSASTCERCDLFSLDRRAGVLGWCWVGTELTGHPGHRAQLLPGASTPAAQPFLPLCCWLYPQSNYHTPEINPCGQAPCSGITEQSYSCQLGWASPVFLISLGGQEPRGWSSRTCAACAH